MENYTYSIAHPYQTLILWESVSSLLHVDTWSLSYLIPIQRFAESLPSFVIHFNTPLPTYICAFLTLPLKGLKHPPCSFVEMD